MKIEKVVPVTIEVHILKVLIMTMIKGDAVKEGSLIEVSRDEAANFVRRGVAREATEEEVAAATHIIATGTVDAVDDMAQRLRNAAAKAICV
jgi:hypothetical protein